MNNENLFVCFLVYNSHVIFMALSLYISIIILIDFGQKFRGSNVEHSREGYTKEFLSVETLETSCFLREFLFHIMSIPDVSCMEISCFLDI